MQTASSRLLTAGAVAGAMALLVAGHPAKVRAQTTLLCPGGTALINGECRDGGASGAALASQALSDLSETTTQESSRNTLKTVAERREKERERCAPGFRRVDGACEPITPPVAEAAPPPPSPKVKKAKKPKVAAIRPEEEHVPAAPAVRRAAPPAMVCKDGPCAPIPIEPEARFGTWAQVNGDYEHRDASGPAFVTIGSLGFGGLPPGTPIPVQASIQSRSGTVGIQGAATSRPAGSGAPTTG